MIKQRPFLCQPALAVTGLLSALICHAAAIAQPPTDLERQWREKKEAKLANSPQGQAEASALGAQLRQVLPPPPAAKPALGPGRANLPLATPDFSGRRRAAQTLSGWTIVRDPNSGLPVSMDNHTPPVSAKALVRPDGVEPQAAARAFIAANAQLFGLEDHQTALEHRQTVTDPLGQHHVVFDQQCAGLPIWGCNLAVHLDPSGQARAFNGRYRPTPPVLPPTQSAIKADKAVSIATAHLADTVPSQVFPAHLAQLLDYEGPTARLCFWSPDNTAELQLVWHVEIRPNLHQRWFYFVGANNGTILESYNAAPTIGPSTAQAVDANGVIQTLNIFDNGESFFFIDASRPIYALVQPDPINDPRGALWTVDLRNQDLGRNTRFYHVSSNDNSWNDPVAVSAHHHAGQIFDYFLNTHNRQGIDGRGSTIVSVVHITQDGRPMDNAFWNGRFIAYGDGDRAFAPLAGALDVAAHEMTHGIIERTVNLEYRFQSGALNESFADVFAVMVDRDDWQLAEDIVRGRAFPSGAMRDMADPHNGGSAGSRTWQPAHMDEFVQLNLSQDNGGVHINSGIPNRACFLVAQAIGRDKTEQLYYRILDARYLNTRSNFADLRRAAIRAATDLFGPDEITAVETAFNQVGITDNSVIAAPATDLNPVEGEEWIALVNAEAGDNSLFLVRPQIDDNTDINRLTTTQVNTRTSNPIAVADDGSMILFVDESNFVRSIRPDGSDERVISRRGAWASIALSPNGRYLAATTDNPDSTIFVFDLEDSSGDKQIHLYNPTTQDGVRSFTTLFADALDWDLSSRFLVFDAFNRIEGNAAGAIEFWNVNLLDLENELILPLFPALPEGVSMGNPSYAQTNDNFLVFDLLDTNLGTGEIWAADLFSGQLTLIEDNRFTIGHPKYSPDDTQLIFQQMTPDSTLVLRQIPLQADKTSPAGPSQPYAREGQLPVWFAIGQRAIPEDETPTAVVGAEQSEPTAFSLAPNYPNPFNPQTAIPYSLPAAGQVQLVIYNLVGQQVAVLADGSKPGGTHRAVWNGRDNQGRPAASGIYFYRLSFSNTSTQEQQTRKLTLLR